MGPLLVTSFAFPGIALGQLSSTASILFRGPSARTEAMGRLSTAVFWGPFPDTWSNPALLGYHRGVRYEWSRTQLVPDFTDDTFFRSNRLTVGGWGIAAELNGVPFPDAGGMLFDVAGDSREEVNSWGVGVNGVELIESLRSDGKVYSLSRYVDGSFGFARKDVRVSDSEVTTHDYGFAVRLTPYNTINHTGVLPALDETIGLRLDISAGWARMNDENETMQFGLDSQPVARMENKGLAVRGSVGMPKQILTDLDSKGAGWLGEALSPLFSLGFNWDNSQETYVDEGGVESEGLLLPSHGWELTLLNVISVRRGEYDTWNDFQNPIVTERSTSGWGLAFDVPGIGGLHYDRAAVEVPAPGLSHHEPTAFGFWVDPIGLWNVFK